VRLAWGVHGGPGAREDEQGARLHAGALARVPNWTLSVTKIHNKAISTTILHCISSSIYEALKVTRAMSYQLMSGVTRLENI
jgi:hypothetical protein